MNILHVTRTYSPDTHGGIEEVIRQISLNSKHYGVESRVFTLSKNPFPKIINRVEAEVFRAPCNIEIASCGMSVQALSLFKEHVNWADIVHYHFPWPFADILHFFCQVKKKTIITYHSDIVRQKKLMKLYLPLMNNFLGSVETIVATSMNYAENSHILQKYTKKTEIIPIGLSENSYPRPLNSDLISMQNRVSRDFFLFIGNLRQYKGLNILLEAIHNTNLQCVIAGTGDVEDALKLKAKQMDLTNVKFLGLINDIEKVALLSLCRAVVFSSHLHSEAFGVTLVEGAMFRKPLISTELETGTSYVNINGETGFVVPPSNVKSLREAMMKLENNKLLADKMGHSARNRYEKLFKGKVMGKKYVEIYKNLLNNGNTSE